MFPSDTIGERPEVEIIPETNYITVVNKAKTFRKGHADGLTIEREHGTNKLIVSGNITMDSTIEVWRDVWEPTDYALHNFKQTLENQGIQNVNIKRRIAPVEARQLILKESIPLKDLLIPFYETE